MWNFSSKERTIFSFSIILGLSLVILIYLLPEISADCKSDCSKTTDEVPVCHSNCDGDNGCNFVNERTKEVCTDVGSVLNTSVGNIQSYDEANKVICCKGSPYSNRQADVGIPGAKNVARVTRIVFWRGKFVKLVVDMFN